jgi:hypothetical protein
MPLAVIELSGIVTSCAKKYDHQACYFLTFWSQWDCQLQATYGKLHPHVFKQVSNYDGCEITQLLAPENIQTRFYYAEEASKLVKLIQIYSPSSQEIRNHIVQLSLELEKKFNFYLFQLRISYHKKKGN